MSELIFGTCVKCSIGFDEICTKFFCKECEVEVKNRMINIGALNSDKHIGKNFKVWVKNNAHPRMKYEHHLIKVYPNRYFNYEPVFIGKLVHVYNDKWCQGMTVKFNNVSFVNDKNKIINNLDINVGYVLFYEEVY